MDGAVDSLATLTFLLLQHVVVQVVQVVQCLVPRFQHTLSTHRSVSSSRCDGSTCGVKHFPMSPQVARTDSAACAECGT